MATIYRDPKITLQRIRFYGFKIYICFYTINDRICRSRIGKQETDLTYPTLPSTCPLIHPVPTTTREWKGYGHLCMGRGGSRMEERQTDGLEIGQMFHGHALRFVSGSSRHMTAAFWWFNQWCFWASWSGGDDYKMMRPSVTGQAATGVLKPRVRWQLKQYRRIFRMHCKSLDQEDCVDSGRKVEEYEICKLKNTGTREWLLCNRWNWQYLFYWQTWVFVQLVVRGWLARLLCAWPFFAVICISCQLIKSEVLVLVN